MKNHYNEKAGKKFDAGVEGNIQKNIKGAGAGERARYAMNPEKWVEGIAARGHDAGVQALQKLGFDKKEAEDMYSEIATPTAGVAGSIAIAEITSRIRGNGSYVGRVYTGVKDYLSGKNLEPDKQSVDSTENSNNPQPDSEVNNKGQHDDSFNKDITNDSTTEKKVNRNPIQTHPHILF